jgi:hypothetical protein
MAALVAAIHVFDRAAKTWMAGTSLHSGRPKVEPECPALMAPAGATETDGGRKSCAK